VQLARVRSLKIKRPAPTHALLIIAYRCVHQFSAQCHLRQLIGEMIRLPVPIPGHRSRCT
jgi:hypothetical protein